MAVREGLRIAARATLALSLGGVPGEAVGERVEQIGTMRHQPLVEVSGIAKSRTYDDVYWVHNDSGDEARIFAVNGRGEVLVPPFPPGFHGDVPEPDKEPWPGIRILQASNVDWEDIALSDGRIYIAEMGNNANARRDLGIYVVNEPNPRATGGLRALRFVPVRYPDQEFFPARRWHFDSEGLFVSEGKLYVLTKHRKAGEFMSWEPGTVLYRLDIDDPVREHVLVRVDERNDVTLVTAADLSPSGERLALLTYTALWVFEKPEQGDRWLQGRTLRLDLDREQMKINEAVTWLDEETLLIANEDRDLFRVSLSSLRPVE